MIEIPPAIMESLWALILALIAAAIAYLEKMKKDDIVAFMDPTDTKVLSAPDGVPAVTYTMATEEKAKLLGGKSSADTQAILQQIAAAENEKLATYTISYSGGSYEIEYGYIKAQTTKGSGAFDPRESPAEGRGFDANGNWVRGLKMPDERFENMVTGHTPEDRAWMRSQVDQAELGGLREYKVSFSGGYYLIENGIVKGGSGAPVK